MNCVIVGGGVIGLLSARELAAGGAHVTVLERGLAGRESSWAGGGILSPLYPWLAPEPLLPLVMWSQHRWPALADELREETGIDIEWQPSGVLLLEPDGEERASAWAEQHHYPIERLDGERLRECEPAVAADTGLWLPWVAQLRNPRLLHALTASLRRRGVEILEQREVTRLSFAGGRVTGVDTELGPIHADCTIVAAGAWTTRLLPQDSGVPPITPVRGQMIAYQAPPGLLRRIVLKHDCYLIPRRDGVILAGSTVEYAGFDKSVTERARQGLRERSRRLVPALGRLNPQWQWAGLRPGIEGELPVMGPIRGVGGLHVASGHFRNGVALAPGSARLLTDLVLGRPPLLEPGPFAPERPRV